MQRIHIILWMLLICTAALSQRIDTHHINPDSTSYPNVNVKKVAEDSLQSIFMIGIKNRVQPHYHTSHTEYVEILSGKGRMTLNGKTFIVHRHDKIIIPRGSIHSVINLNYRPLKVLSIQCPKYDGDRVILQPKIEAQTKDY